MMRASRRSSFPAGSQLGRERLASLRSGPFSAPHKYLELWAVAAPGLSSYLATFLDREG
jgi:hypothetical protein